MQPFRAETKSIGAEKIISKTKCSKVRKTLYLLYSVIVASRTEAGTPCVYYFISAY